MSGCFARRQVLLATGAGAGVLALAACAEESSPTDEPQPGVVLLSLNELEVGQAQVTTTDDGVAVAVVRTGEDEVRAFSAICTHQGCEVRAEESDLYCPCHGSRFEFADGAVIDGPAEDPLPEVSVEIQQGNVVTR